MPEATLQAVAAYADATPDAVTGRYDDARGIIEDLARAGVDLDDVAVTLEREGIASFEKSWNELIASVEKELERAGADVSAGGAVSPATGRKPVEAKPAAVPAATARTTQVQGNREL